jgi:hypothetical protein
MSDQDHHHKSTGKNKNPPSQNAKKTNHRHGKL